jgi:hypothetical protein
MRSPQDSGASQRGSQGEDYEDVYDMYGRQPAPLSRRATTRTQEYISEGEEEDEEYVNSYDEGDFEMISRNGPPAARSSRQGPSQRRSVPEVKKIRVKVHADDTRYVLVGTAVEFKDFIDQIRIKFGLRQSFKIKIKDEGDMITMADQDDLDMALQQAKTEARKEKSEMGKLEVCFLHPLFPSQPNYYTNFTSQIWIQPV